MSKAQMVGCWVFGYPYSKAAVAMARYSMWAPFGHESEPRALGASRATRARGRRRGSEGRVVRARQEPQDERRRAGDDHPVRTELERSRAGAAHGNLYGYARVDRCCARRHGSVPPSYTRGARLAYQYPCHHGYQVGINELTSIGIHQEGIGCRRRSSWRPIHRAALYSRHAPYLCRDTSFDDNAPRQCKPRDSAGLCGAGRSERYP